MLTNWIPILDGANCQYVSVFISYTVLFTESVFHSLTCLSFNSTNWKWIDIMYRHFDVERIWLNLDEIHTDNCFRFKLKANKGIEYNTKLIANKWKTCIWINIELFLSFQCDRFNTIGLFHNDILSAARFSLRYLVCTRNTIVYSNVVQYHEYRTIEISQVASYNANLLFIFIKKPIPFKSLMLFNFQNNEAQSTRHNVIFSALKICWNSVKQQ